MNKDEFIKRYYEKRGTKSGFLILRDNAEYLFGNQFCGANCRQIVIKSNSTEIFSRSHENIMALVCEGACEIYVNGKAMIRPSEIMICYEIPLKNGTVYGVITGGKEHPAESLQFSEKSIMELILRLISRRRTAENVSGRSFEELCRALDRKETKALSEMYLEAKPLKNEVKT